MGLCASSEKRAERNHSQAIDRMLEEDSLRIRRELKILLLGIVYIISVDMTSYIHIHRQWWIREIHNRKANEDHSSKRLYYWRAGNMATYCIQEPDWMCSSTSQWSGEVWLQVSRGKEHGMYQCASCISLSDNVSHIRFYSYYSIMLSASRSVMLWVVLWLQSCHQPLAAYGETKWWHSCLMKRMEATFTLWTRLPSMFLTKTTPTITRNNWQ